MSWAQNVLGTESLIWAQNVQAQNRRLKIAGTESLGTKSGTFPHGYLVNHGTKTELPDLAISR